VRPLLLAAVLVVPALILAGCEPTCRQACRKVLSCESLDAETVLDECEASCVFQEELYEERGDEARADALGDHKGCLRRESCDAIADGVCYDPELFVFETDSTPSED
jgi:hypothetical protein